MYSLASHIQSHETLRRQLDKLKREVSDREKQLSTSQTEITTFQTRRSHTYETVRQKTKEFLPSWAGEDMVLKSNETAQKLQTVIQTKQARLDKEKQSAGR